MGIKVSYSATEGGEGVTFAVASRGLEQVVRDSLVEVLATGKITDAVFREGIGNLGMLGRGGGRDCCLNLLLLILSVAEIREERRGTFTHAFTVFLAETITVGDAAGKWLLVCT